MDALEKWDLTATSYDEETSILLVNYITQQFLPEVKVLHKKLTEE